MTCTNSIRDSPKGHAAYLCTLAMTDTSKQPPMYAPASSMPEFFPKETDHEAAVNDAGW